MFKHLTNLSYKRSGKEALGFYLAYLLLIGLISALINAVIGGATHYGPLMHGVRVGTVVAIILCTGLAYLVADAKKLTNQFGYILLIVITGLLSLFGGGILGMIIPASFTTQGASSKKKKK